VLTRGVTAVEESSDKFHRSLDSLFNLFCVLVMAFIIFPLKDFAILFASMSSHDNRLLEFVHSFMVCAGLVAIPSSILVFYLYLRGKRNAKAKEDALRAAKKEEAVEKRALAKAAVEERTAARMERRDKKRAELKETTGTRAGANLRLCSYRRGGSYFKIH
jgi:hypothetical protein